MAEPIVVWLASFPRSGNTFVRHVIQELYEIPTYTCYPGEARVTGITQADNRWPQDADSDLPVHFVKVHEAELASCGGPAIHIVRDGRDSLVSYAHFRRDIMGDRESLDVLLDKLAAGDASMPHWGLHTLAWSTRDVPHIRFKDLIAHPIEVVQRAVEALNLPLTPCENPNVETFHTLHQMKPQFFRAGTTDQWRAEMTPQQLDTFWQMHGVAQKWFETKFTVYEDEYDNRGRTRAGKQCDSGSVCGVAERQGPGRLQPER